MAANHAIRTVWAEHLATHPAHKPQYWLLAEQPLCETWRAQCHTNAYNKIRTDGRTDVPTFMRTECGHGREQTPPPPRRYKRPDSPVTAFARCRSETACSRGRQHEESVRLSSTVYLFGRGVVDARRRVCVRVCVLAKAAAQPVVSSKLHGAVHLCAVVNGLLNGCCTVVRLLTVVHGCCTGRSAVQLCTVAAQVAVQLCKVAVQVAALRASAVR